MMEKLTRLPKNTLASVMFLSRLPVWRLKYGDEDAVPDFKSSAYTFALAGLIIAMPAAAMFWFAGMLNLPTYLIAVLTITTLIFTTGAIHEDGLGDVADGFWGGHTVEKKLSIMRDSMIGTYGTLALIAAFLVRTSALSTIAGRYDFFIGLAAIFGTVALSRTAMLWPWFALSNARSANSKKTGKNGKDESGLSIRYGEPDKNTLLWGAACALPAIVLLLLGFGVAKTIAALLFLVFAMLAITRLAKKHIGGHTGDVLGATQQVSELGLYIGLVMAI